MAIREFGGSTLFAAAAALTTAAASSSSPTTRQDGSVSPRRWRRWQRPAWLASGSILACALFFSAALLAARARPQTTTVQLLTLRSSFAPPKSLAASAVARLHKTNASPAADATVAGASAAGASAASGVVSGAGLLATQLVRAAAQKDAPLTVTRLGTSVTTAAVHEATTAVAAAVAPASGVPAPATAAVAVPHGRSRLFEHFDKDGDGVLSEKEVAALLKLLRQGGGLGGAASGGASAGAAGASGSIPGTAASGGDGTRHDVTIDGETLSFGQSDFDLLFKQLSNVKHTRDPSKDPRMTLQEDIVFIKDLVIVTGVATLGGLVATALQQPPLLGFVLAGMIVGPGGFAAITELVEVETLASLGIAFLLFSLGIEFSITELASVRRVAILGGILSMCGVVAVIGSVGLLLSLVHSVPEAVALGLAVSLSSTAVVLPCLPAHPGGGHGGSGDGGGSFSDTAGGRGHHRRSRSGDNNRPPGAGCNASGDASELSPKATSSSSGSSVGDSFALVPSGGGGVGGGGPGGGTTLSTGKVKGKTAHGGPGETASGGGGGGTSTVMGFSHSHTRKVMLGLLVFQDIMIGLILALLPTLGGTVTQFMEEFLSAGLRLALFVVLSLIVSEFFLPGAVDRLDRCGSPEVFTLGVVVLALAFSYLSEQLGLAIELGAFVAGLMLSENRHKLKVEGSIRTIRDLFTAVFFVSIGMMIHWRYFLANSWRMATLLVLVLVVKSAIMTSVTWAFGRVPLRTALGCGVSLAQAGEFTFVVANKGQSLQLFSPSEARMILGATAVSMLVTPALVRWANRFAPQTTNGTSCGLPMSQGRDTESV
ncbi:hypothetical protein I4F81_010331 [Pyropia yezoensis]|uniref:Uncharacterized protein n=1 Tax=Pyropia yezoensis TaxID=2788 RepID=A0ACC3CCK9_PYRYE|nr:hypothetical protein I4F81_010331 [Neopyropia yezoensis]